MGYQLAVDLGTTYTAAALYRDGRVELVPLGDRSTVLPSVAFVRADGGVLIGEAANRRGVLEPERVAREFKRRVGDPTPLVVGGSPYPADVLMAHLLRTVVAEVAEREGADPDALTVTHPANWGAYKLDFFRQAVAHAGITCPVTYLSEPEAAAMHYATEERVPDGSVVAVYDLGGGTFDAAVLRRSAAGGFEVAGRPEGIERLGGVDFDAGIFAHVDEVLGGAVSGLDGDDEAAVQAVARLRAECVEAKEVLSRDADVAIPAVLPNRNRTVRLTRAEFEDMIRPALGETITALRRALASAHVTPEDVHAVLLVGGSSRIPLVAQMLSAALDRPIAVDAHPKHAIAQGAATAGAERAGGATPHADTRPETTEPAAPPIAAPPLGTGPVDAPPPETAVPLVDAPPPEVAARDAAPSVTAGPLPVASPRAKPPRRRARLALIGTATVVAAAIAALAARPGSSGGGGGGGGGGTPAYAVFNEEHSMDDELLELVEATPAGATIHGAMYTWTRAEVAIALRDAQERGVEVRLAVDWDGNDGANADPDNDAINTLEDAGLTQLVLCNEGDEDSSACVSERDGSFNDNRTFTFSQTGDMSEVIFVSSHNLINSAVDFDAATVMHGDGQLYDGFVRYMAALLAEEKDNDFFNSPNGQIASRSGDIEAMFSPRADSAGGTDGEAETDTMVDILSEVTEGDGCEVAVAHRHFTTPREPVADELIRLGEAGCTVRVAAGSNMYDEIRDMFDATDAVDVRQDDAVHSQYMVIRGTIDGEPDRAIVVAGSHLSRSALRLHDGTLIHMELDEIVSAYEENFEVIWDHLG